MPDDWHVYVRSEQDLPVAKREPLMKQLEEKGWKIDWEKKKITEGPLRKVDVSFQPTNVPGCARRSRNDEKISVETD